MIDPVGYIKEHAWLQATIATNFLFEAPKSRNSGEREYLHNLRSIDLASLSEEELMTFPSRIGGYSLVTKDAGFFLVDRLKPVVWEEARVEHIRESTPKLQLVLRVASGFSFSSGQFNYEIEKKGRGLVFLLYGPSGTGKTLTAGKSFENSPGYLHLNML
jgi:Cdc6-like AAA superfamily ATPase